MGRARTVGTAMMSYLASRMRLSSRFLPVDLPVDTRRAPLCSPAADGVLFGVLRKNERRRRFSALLGPRTPTSGLSRAEMSGDSI